jgi:hypothetical protein
MDAADLAAAFDMPRLPGGVLPLAAGGSNARTSDWRGASPFRAASLAKIVERLIGERVQAATSDILFNLTVPRSGIELREPCPECGEFSSGKPQYGFLDLFHTAHNTQLTCYRLPEQQTRNRLQVFT